MQEIKALADEMMIILSGCQGEVLLQNAMNYKAKMVNVYMEVEQCVKQQLRGKPSKFGILNELSKIAH